MSEGHHFDSLRFAVEDFAHEAAENWPLAARAAEYTLKHPPDGDEWTEDMEAALKGIARAFRAAADEKALYEHRRRAEMLPPRPIVGMRDET